MLPPNVTGVTLTLIFFPIALDGILNVLSVTALDVLTSSSLLPSTIYHWIVELSLASLAVPSE